MRKSSVRLLRLTILLGIGMLLTACGASPVQSSQSQSQASSQPQSISIAPPTGEQEALTSTANDEDTICFPMWSSYPSYKTEQTYTYNDG